MANTAGWAVAADAGLLKGLLEIGNLTEEITGEELQKQFGKHRVFDTPINECGIIGAAVGMGAYGLRPVPEIHDVCAYLLDPPIHLA